AAPAVVGSCLAIAIWLYDAGLKRSWAGAALMGWCRFLNVLLGASVAADLAEQPAPWVFSAAVGLYTFALTLIAQSEVAEDAATRRKDHAAQFGLAATGLLAASLPYLLAAPKVGAVGSVVFGVEFGALLFLFRSARRVESPDPRRRLVGRMIQCFIVTDAVAAAIAAGWGSGIAVACLLIPTLALSRRTAMT
ncbi:MAG: hypothetical protein AAF961_18055, partial [Planctomycetota bacterium]